MAPAEGPREAIRRPPTPVWLIRLYDAWALFMLGAGAVLFVLASVRPDEADVLGLWGAAAATLGLILVVLAVLARHDRHIALTHPHERPRRR